MQYMMPSHGRKEAFGKVSEIVFGFKFPPVILEVGCSRNEEDYETDGNSSALFAYLALSTGGTFDSVDVDVNSVIICNKILRKLGLTGANVNIHSANAFTFLPNWEIPLDVIYLDGWDFTIVPESARNHLIAFMMIEDLMKPGSLVVIDDIFNMKPLVGKGSMLIPYCLKKQYEIVHKGYTFILRKKK